MALAWLPTVIGLLFSGASTAAAWLALRILADPRREPPEVPEPILPHKRVLRRGLRIEAMVFLALLAYGTARLLGNHALAAAGCGGGTVSALGLLLTLDHVLMAAGAAAWLLGLGLGIRHMVRLRREGWVDPKGRDLVAIHLTLLPIALIAFTAALTVNAARVC